MEFKNKYFDKIERTIVVDIGEIQYFDKIILKLKNKVIAKGETLKELLDCLKIKYINCMVEDKNMVIIYSSNSYPKEDDYSKEDGYSKENHYLKFDFNVELTDDFLYKTFYEIDELLKSEPIISLN